jgi:hypothetical protein
MTGMTNRRELADAVGCDMNTVVKDLRYLRAVCEKEAAELISNHQAQEVMKLQRLEQEAFASWEASKRDEEIAEMTTVIHDDKTKTTKTTARRRKRHGDAALLRVLLDISNRRDDLLHVKRDDKEHQGLRIVNIDTPACSLTDEELEEVIRQHELSGASEAVHESA